MPLAKGTLVTHCYKDLGFMDFICSLVTKSVKVSSTLFHERVIPLEGCFLGLEKANGLLE